VDGAVEVDDEETKGLQRLYRGNDHEDWVIEHGKVHHLVNDVALTQYEEHRA
jgi:hypothetical protein